MPQSSGTSMPQSSTGQKSAPSSTCAADFSGDQRREQIIRFRAIAHHSTDPERRALIMGDLAILEMRENNKKAPPIIVMSFQGDERDPGARPPYLSRTSGGGSWVVFG